MFTSILASTFKQLEEMTWRVGDSWSHSATDQEGFKSGSATIGGNRVYLNELFENGLGRHWRTEDFEGNTAWEGMVWSLQLVDEGWQYTRSLDAFANRLRVLYSSTATGERLHAPSSSTWEENTDSQAQYGIREMIHSIGETNATRALGLADIELADLAWPGRSKRYTGATGTTLSIQLRGYMDTLAWRIYNDLTSGLEDSSVMVDRIVSGVGQFINSTEVETNTFDFSAYHNRDRYALSILRDLVSTGDGTNPWIIGVYEDRVLHYQSRPTTVNLHWAKGSPNPTQIGGQPVQPWMIRPGDVIRSDWILPGYDLDIAVGEDPMVLQVREASFQAPYRVSLTGADDEQVEIMLNRIQKTRW